MAITRFTDIEAWKEARRLTRSVCVLTRLASIASDRFLSDQMRRAAVSAMSNIAEGFSRKTPSDFARFLDIARASVSELQSLAYVAHDNCGLSAEHLRALLNSSERAISLISALARYIRSPVGRRNAERRTPNAEP